MRGSQAVDVLALPISEVGVRVLQDLGAGPLDVASAAAIEAVLAGQPSSLDVADVAAACRVLCAVAVELVGPVTLTAPADQLDAVGPLFSRAVRIVGERGLLRLSTEAPTEGVWLALGPVEGSPLLTVQVVASAAQAGPALTLVDVAEDAVLPSACALVAACDRPGCVLVVAPNASTAAALVAGLEALELDVWLLDPSTPSTRKHALAARARRGEVEAWVATDGALGDIDGRGFAMVLFVSPVADEGWMRRAGRAARVALVQHAPDRAFWTSSASRAGLVLTEAAPPASADPAARLSQVVLDLAGDGGVLYRTQVQALMASDHGVGVLAAALRGLVRQERERQVSVAALSEPSSPPKHHLARRDPKPVPVVVAPPNPVEAVDDAPRKKRRRRRRRTTEPSATATTSTVDEDDGPVDIDLADLDAVLDFD